MADTDADNTRATTSNDLNIIQKGEGVREERMKGRSGKIQKSKNVGFTTKEV